MPTICLEVEEFRYIKQRIHHLGIRQQRMEIMKLSPYSADITPQIHIYNELRLYCSLELQESYITRPCLVKDIDFDLWISSENCTNLELMQQGKSPYAFDAPEGRIEIHHIGQRYDAPFVELTLEEHNDNSHLLHSARRESWRSEKSLANAYEQERISYWKRRAKRDYTISDAPVAKLEEYHYKKQQEYSAEIRETCEEIYFQCGVEDLEYLSDLAKSYAMMRRVGATTIGEFLSNVREIRQTEILCPFCKVSDYILSGVYRAQGENIQRYKCKACGKVFTPNRQSLVSGSSFSFRDWIKFIDCLYNGYTLKQIARACDISERTAHDNRTKLFYALKLLNDQVQLKGNVVIDETYLPVSFKGNHSQDNFIMPRAANNRGGENHQPGITDNLVCIVCAVDDCGNSVAKVAGTGIISAPKLRYVLKQHMGSDIFCLYSDKSRPIHKFAEESGYEIKQEKLLYKDGKLAANVEFNRDTFVINRYLQIVNSYHSRLKKFLSRFAGISTKYLSGYLYLFAWKERNKERESAEVYKELLAVMTEPDNYRSVKDILKEGHLPDAVEISNNYRKKKFIPSERDNEIYRRFAAGESMTSIGKDLGVTKQAISLIVQKFRKNGLAYKTEADKQREQIRKITPQGYIEKSSLDYLIRDYQIYSARMQWEGTADEFNNKMSVKFGLSIQSIKNIVSRMKRFVRLKEEIFVYEDITYRSLEDVYRMIYTDYCALQAANPNLSMNALATALGEKYNFTAQNIYRIIQILTQDIRNDYFVKKRKLSIKETYNRDKALFIDYLRWPGERVDFCYHAAKKYNLSFYYVEEILKYCLYADPERYNMI